LFNISSNILPQSLQGYLYSFFSSYEDPKDPSILKGKGVRCCFLGFGSVKMFHFPPSCKCSTVAREQYYPHMIYESGLRRINMTHYRIEKRDIFDRFIPTKSILRSICPTYELTSRHFVFLRATTVSIIVF